MSSADFPPKPTALQAHITRATFAQPVPRLSDIPNAHHTAFQDPCRTEMETKRKVIATRGSELLRHVQSVDPRVAEGLNRGAAAQAAAASQKELEDLLEEQKRRGITDPYQSFLYDVRLMHKKGNFKGSEGEAILRRIRELAEKEEKTLDLSGFCVRDDFAMLMIDFLKSKSSRITALNIARTQIGIEGATAIARAINAALEQLQFSESPLPVGVFRKESQTTRNASLSGRNLNHLDASAIGILVERESRKLERLDVSNNRLTGPQSNVFHGITILLDGLMKCPRLRELNLSSVDLRAEGITALADVVAELTSVEKLNIGENNVCSNSFGDRNVSGIESFCNCLWKAKKLRDLSLAKNELDYVSCRSLAAMLAVNQRLKRLDLSSNPIAEAGAVQLALGIKKSPVLEDLNLSACSLTCEAVHALTESLRKFNRTLQILSLRDNNDIRSHGFKDLAHCVSINPTLLVVDVNPRSTKYEPIVAKMKELLRVNTALVALRHSFKSFDFESLTEVLRTSFIEKLSEFSNAELEKLFDMQVMEDVEIGQLESFEAAVSSLRYYSEMQQYAPLKRLLWILESGARRDLLKARPVRKDHTKAPRQTRSSSNNGNHEDEDEDDIWDYPIV